MPNRADVRFSRGASRYHDLAAVQHQVAAWTAERLLTLNIRPRTALEFGCGTGMLTELLLGQYPEASLCAVDISSAMIEEVRGRIVETSPTFSRLSLACADILDYSAVGNYDLVVSSSAVQWIPLAPLFGRVWELLGDGGWFVFSAMVEGTMRELRSARSKIAPSKEFKEFLPSVADLGSALKGAKFEIVDNENRQLVYCSESVERLFEELRTLGFSYNPVAVGISRLNRGEVLQLKNIIESSAGPSGCKLTYEVCYFAARKRRGN